MYESLKEKAIGYLNVAIQYVKPTVNKAIVIGTTAATLIGGGSAYANDAVTNRGEAVFKIFPGTLVNAPHHFVDDGLVGVVEAGTDVLSTLFRGVIFGQKTPEVFEYSIESSVIKDQVEKLPGGEITANLLLGGAVGAVAGHNGATIFNSKTFGSSAGDGLWAGAASGGVSAIPGALKEE